MDERPFDHRQFMAKSRPRNRGPVLCNYPYCDASFKDEWAATQHRRAAHNERTPMPDDPRAPQESEGGQ